jgi:putative flippase GtrA
MSFSEVLKEQEDARSSRLGSVLRHSAVRYVLAGGASFVVDFGLLTLFHEVFGWLAGVASGVSFLISFVFTYSVQRIYSFGSDVPHGGALVRYAVLVGINTLATIGIVAFLTPTPIGWAGGKIVATVVSTVWNYFAYRYWIFAEARKTSQRQD